MSQDGIEAYRVFCKNGHRSRSIQQQTTQYGNRVKERVVAWTSSQMSLSTRVNKGKINMRKIQLTILAAALAGTMSASAAITLDVVASSAPNYFGSPSW